MRQSVAVIDYGSGNLHSVAKAVEHAGSNQVVVTSDAATIAAADRVILPGVGAMGDCMRGLQERGLDSVVLGLIGKKPLMAVCVGMQILTEFGEESSGIHALGVFQGHITQFPQAMTGRAGEPLKVPHMGWNEVTQDFWLRRLSIWLDPSVRFPTNTEFHGRLRCSTGMRVPGGTRPCPTGPRRRMGSSRWKWVDLTRSTAVPAMNWHP